MGKQPPFVFDPSLNLASEQMQQFAQSDAFLANFKTPSDIEEYKNYVLDTQFQSMGVTSPFTVLDKGRAIFNQEAEPLDFSTEDTPEQIAYKDINNRLVKYGGRLPEPDFLRKTFGNSMTAQWIKLITDEDVSEMYGNFGVSDKGITYDGKKLNLTPEQSKTISDYINRNTGADAETSFLDKIAETAVSLSFDLPLMALTGGIASGAMKATQVTAALARSTNFFPRLLGQVVQQSVNFNLLGLPQTVTAIKDDGIGGALSNIWHSVEMGTLAATTGTLGTRMFKPVSLEMFKRNPALAEELGGLAGSFGFGALESKLAGLDTTDAIATGLAFAATHFTNPRAYKRVITEQQTKPLKVLAEVWDNKGGVFKFHPDYFIEKENKLLPIDKTAFKNEGRIIPLETEGIVITDAVRKSVRYYNEVPDHYKLSYGQALAESRQKQNGKKLYEEWKKELPEDYVKDNTEQLRSLAETVSTMSVGANLSKTFAKWRLPEDADLTNKMIKIASDYSLPYSDVKKYVISNISDYVKNPEGFADRLRAYEQGYESPIYKDLAKLMDTANKAFVKKVDAKINFKVTSDGKLKTESKKPDLDVKIKFPKVEMDKESSKPVMKEDEYATQVLDKAKFEAPEDAFKIIQAARQEYRKQVKPLELVKEEVKTEVDVKPKEEIAVEPVKPAVEEVKTVPEAQIVPETSGKPVEAKSPLLDTKVASEIKEALKPSKEEFPTEKSGINDLSLKVKENREFLADDKQSRPAVVAAFEEAKQLTNRLNKEEIADASQVPSKDILALVLDKSGHTEPEIAAILSKATGQSANEDAVQYIKAKYTPGTSRFNQKAYNRIANSDIMKMQQELIKERTVEEKPEEVFDLAPEQPLREKPSEMQDLSDPRDVLEQKLTDEITGVQARFGDQLEVIQPIKNPDKKIAQVAAEVDKMLKGRQITLDNYEKVSEVMRNSEVIRKLGSGNFDANAVAEQIVQNRAMGRADNEDVLYETVRTPRQPMTPEEVMQRAETLRAELEPYGVDVEVGKTPEGKGGYTLFKKDGSSKIRISPEFASENTFNEERFHTLTNLATDTRSLDGILRKYGWDSKARNESWGKANERMYDAYKAFSQGYGESNPIFTRMKEVYEKISNWFKGNGYWSEGEFLRKYAEGRLEFNKVKTDEAILFESINEPESIDPRKQTERFEALYERNKKDKLIDLSDVGLNKILNSPINIGLKGKDKAYRLWTLSLPPAYTKYKFPIFAKIREIGESEIIRKSAGTINRIIREKWENGKYFRALPENTQQGVMDANRKYEKEMQDGTLLKQLSTDEFIERYNLNKEQVKVVRMYQEVKDEAIDVARKGWKERLMNHTSNLAGELNKSELKKLFPDIADVTEGKANEFMASDKYRKELVATYISNKLFDYGDKYYFNSVRPNDPDTWIVELKRADGKRISTYAYSKEEANKLIKDYQTDGYGIGEGDLQLYRIGDILKEGEYWNRLSEQQLLNLANAGHIDLNDNVVKKLREAVKAGKFKQHGIDKEFVPGLHHTPEEYETGLQRLVNEAVYSNYRHNAIAQMKEVMGNWRSDMDTKMKDPNVSDSEKANLKLEYDYTNGYINNITFSDNSVLDNYRGIVASMYTALKPSFLFQQAMQPVQTTWAVAAQDKSGSKHFYSAMSDTFDLIKQLNARRKNVDADFVSKELVDVYQQLADMNKLGKVGIEELTSQSGAVDYHYAKGAERFRKVSIKLLNAASGGIEKFTRLQAMNTFYRIGKEKNLQGDKLVNFIADKIDESMSQWGAGGRAPLLASKRAGVKQEPILKGIDKSFMTFKTFATHNLGLYEKLFRDKQWGALGIKLAVGAGLHGITKFPLMATAFAIANLFTEDEADYEVLQAIQSLDDIIGGKVGSILARGTGTLAGVNMSDLFAEHTILPGDIWASTRAYSAEGKVAESMFGAPYGFAKDVLDEASALKTHLVDMTLMDKSLTEAERKVAHKNLIKILPLFIRNALTSMTMANDGIEVRGRQVIKADDLSSWDVVAKFIGFNPLTVSDAYESQFYGLPAKFARINGKISELKKIRKEISSSDRYDAVGRSNELKKIAEMLKQTNEEKSKMMKQKEFKEALKAGLVKL